MGLMGRILKAQIDKIREMFKAGYTLKEIAKETGVSEPTISKYASDVSEESRGGLPVHYRLRLSCCFKPFSSCWLA